MPTLFMLLLLVVTLPLCGFVILLALGKRLGDPLAGYVGTAFSFAGFASAVAAMATWISRSDGFGYGVAPFMRSWAWLPVGAYAGQRESGFLDFTIYVDSLTVVMLAMVTLVAAVVHLYSLRYLRGDDRTPVYFGRLSLFGFSMCGLLLSGTLLQLLVFWELVGLCSYLLIGYWDEKPEARTAATKAFIINRVGDVGFIIGLCLLIGLLGNTTLSSLWVMLSPSHQTAMSSGMLSLIGCLLFCGAVGKSAQFPLHTWLPDAMAGPTPVSALIHAATMVAAGVFLLIRIDPILTADARLFVVVIGAITIAVGSLSALAQRDLKQALAYSTMAQLGYMVLGVGVGSRDGAGFHLVTHAFFKALLFLAAGVVIYGMHHRSRLEHFGGLFRRMPVTAIAFAIGGLAMSATPYFSGYFSKEQILAAAAAWTSVAHDAGRQGLWELALWIPVIGSYLTPLYMTRLWMLTFAGRPRDEDAFEHAHEPGLLSFPLVVLCGLAVVSGFEWFPVRSMVDSSAVETRAQVAALAGANSQINPLDHNWPSQTSLSMPDVETDTIATGNESPDDRMEAGAARAHRLTHWAWLIGILTGVAAYSRGFALTERLAAYSFFRFPREWLRHRMYFDDLYRWVFVGSARMAGRMVDWMDRFVLDRLIDMSGFAYAGMGRLMARLDDALVDGAVRGITESIQSGGSLTSRLQTGRLRIYVTSVVLATALLAGAIVAWTVFR